MPFIDGDALHPAANVAKMASGTPLTDEDRAPWLRTVGETLAGTSPEGVVVACSALQRAYRDLIRAEAPDAVFAELGGDRALLAARMAARPGRFMPVSLLGSQLATLERLQPDEAGMRLDLARPPAELTADIAKALAATSAHPSGPNGGSSSGGLRPSRGFGVWPAVDKRSHDTVYGEGDARAGK
ncbi:gluconokinase [Leifsonia sp. AG29]|uniref:gluconokinase n=1 Tax=Leifsonia sp. AG29 TaxID=2598860 RepID=UPI001E3D12C3|nr:gluconokinase, GntK/IdnK-type [Leifsonia sp. AG29]